jgi:hypothetical protein
MDEITAMLAQTADNGLYFEDGRYFDWSSRGRAIEPGGLRVTSGGVEVCGFEVGDDDGATQIDLTRDEMTALARALLASLAAWR